MPRVLIENVSDPRLALYRDLKATNATRWLDQFVVEGEKLFERLLASAFPLASVLTSDRYESLARGRVPEAIPHYVVPDCQISRLVGFNFHRGILACGHRLPWPGIDEVVEKAGAGPTSTLALCPRIDNPENLGSLVRIADVFGLDALVVGDCCPDPLSRRVLRVSMGTVLRLPVVIADDLEAAADQLTRTHGYKLVATVVDPEAIALNDFQRAARLVVAFGSEGHGLDPEWLARCDPRITIPMRAGAESLNQAVAAGIVLHHLTRPG
jgi:tRNA G18 (ribose-2'-O)-methylase SpoU